MSMSSATAAYVVMFKSQGWKVYMRKLKSEYCFCTDGIGIAYVQWGDRPSVSTVHKANRTTGTGFQVDDRVTVDAVRKAMRMTVPGWATEQDRASVKKYASWDEYHRESDWNRGLFEI